jgi:hypothetical protein
MEDVRGKYVSPAIDQVAFNCPHCGALAKQFWLRVAALKLQNDRTPTIVTAETAKKLKEQKLGGEEDSRKVRWAERMASGHPFLTEQYRDWCSHDVHNVSISSCFNCHEISLWVHNQLLWPRRAGGPQPNLDLSPDVRRDYEEASTILDASPRAAAALLRLAIQKLCKELGKSGQNINDDIASLVRKGLDPRVQKALDVVRVIGNNSVHPGKIDLRDDRPTAEALFGLVNLICEKMITEPKHVTELFQKLPEDARESNRETRHTQTVISPVPIRCQFVLCSHAKPLICRVSSVVEQRFCKPLVGSSNLSPGTN